MAEFGVRPRAFAAMSARPSESISPLAAAPLRAENFYDSVSFATLVPRFFAGRNAHCFRCIADYLGKALLASISSTNDR
jgi:hypothetical protein